MSFLDSLFGPSKRDSTTTTQGFQSGSSTTSLPDWQMPYIQAQLAKVAGMGGYTPYSGALAAPRSPVATTAENLAMDKAQGSSPLDPANAYNADVLSGKYTGSNPYLDATFNNAAARVGDQFRKITAPGIAANFSLAGRYGSGGQREALGQAQTQLGDNLNRLATDIYGGGYATDRASQEAAASRAPALNAADYEGARVLGNLGSAADQYADNPIARQIQLYQFGQTNPWQQEQARTGILAGDYGRTTQSSGTTTSSSTTPVYGPSPFETALGIGSSAAGMAFPFLKGFKVF